MESRASANRWCCRSRSDPWECAKLFGYSQRSGGQVPRSCGRCQMLLSMIAATAWVFLDIFWWIRR